jgi:hypothetical protein
MPKSKNFKIQEQIFARENKINGQELLKIFNRSAFKFSIVIVTSKKAYFFWVYDLLFL